MSITRIIVKYFTDHNSEMSAVDLLMEMDQIDQLKNYASKDNYKKVYDYLVASSHYSADHGDFTKILEVAYDVAVKFDDFSNGLRVSIKLDDDDKIRNSFESCKDPVYQKQLAFALGRQRIILECENEELVDIFSNSKLSEFYIKLATELNVLAPKKPQEVLKTQIDDSNPSSKIDSAKLNLADTYVNAFVNVGTGQDALMQGGAKEPWIHSVKDTGIMAATASLGLIFLWDFHGCSSAISDYLDMKDGYAKAGALLGIGISNSGTWSELDPAKAILEDSLESPELCVKKGAIIGLGLAYAGTAREEFLETISPHLNDTANDNTIGVNAALSLALIHVGKCNEEVVNSILSSMMERTTEQLNESISKMYGIALGLCFLGRQSLCENALDTLKSIEHPIARFSEVILEACAYIGSGNVLKIQQFLQKCTTHEELENSLPQSAAVMGIALLAISEEVGNEMAVRAMHHIMQYCELHVKRAIPIALGKFFLTNKNSLAFYQ
jgi:26S proteasome regulatory subunit N1